MEVRVDPSAVAIQRTVPRPQPSWKCFAKLLNPVRMPPSFRTTSTGVAGWCILASLDNPSIIQNRDARRDYTLASEFMNLMYELR